MSSSPIYAIDEIFSGENSECDPKALNIRHFQMAAMKLTVKAMVGEERYIEILGNENKKHHSEWKIDQTIVDYSQIAKFAKMSLNGKYLIIKPTKNE